MNMIFTASRCAVTRFARWLSALFRASRFWHSSSLEAHESVLSYIAESALVICCQIRGVIVSCYVEIDGQ